MGEAPFTIAASFPPADYRQWREQAEKELTGALLEEKLLRRASEDLTLQPLYTRADQINGPDYAGFPGIPPFVRGSRVLGAAVDGWDLRQVHDQSDIEEANRAILDDLAGGVTSIELRLDVTARHGHDPDDQQTSGFAESDGVMAYSVDDLDALLADVELAQCPVALNAGAAFFPAAAMLTALWKRREVADGEARGAFNVDPLGTLATTGRLPMSVGSALKMLAELARFTAARLPRVTAVGVDASCYHDAGASAAQDVAFAAATGLEYLRAMTSAGMDVDHAARQLLFRLRLDTQQFTSIAKLRAARRVWSRVVEVCGGSATLPGMRIHALASRRVLSRRDPYMNLLRNAVGVFSACLGGAEIVTSLPFDTLAGASDAFGRRIARNTLLILQHEANLHRVIDPAGGSWFLEQLTDQLAARAWSIFQEIDRAGGMARALQCGWIGDQVGAALAPRIRAVACRKQGIIGVSEFPVVGDDRCHRSPPDRKSLVAAAIERLSNTRPTTPIDAIPDTRDAAAAAVQAAGGGASIGQLSRAIGLHVQQVNTPPLALHRLAEPFEQLRDAVDQWHAKHGRRPRVLLVKSGPVTDHMARTMFSKNFFHAGGFEVIDGDACHDARSAATMLADNGAAARPSSQAVCRHDAG